LIIMGRMHRVVDAMNVIGSRPDGWWRDRAGAIERLVGQVDRWAAESGVGRVTVMLEHEPRRALDPERVEIAWASAGGRDAADREILALLPDWLAEDEVVVVTSDRDLKAKALAAGAEVVPSRPFRVELDSPHGD
jgi:predicted RNA-binding protein with PIN domain